MSVSLRLLTMGTALLPVAAFAVGADPTPTAAGRRTVEVFGTGAATMPCDTFQLNFYARSGTTRPADAQAWLDDAARRASDAVVAAGAPRPEPRGDATTRPATIVIRFADGPVPPPDIRASRPFRVVATSLEQANKARAALRPFESGNDARGGVDNVHLDAFPARFAADGEVLFDPARRAAIADARAQARRSAVAADLKLGPLVSIGQFKLESWSSEDRSGMAARASANFVFEVTD